MSSFCSPDGRRLVAAGPAGKTSLTWWCMQILSVPLPPQLCELLGYWGPLERVGVRHDRSTDTLMIGDGTGWVPADLEAWYRWLFVQPVRFVLGMPGLVSRVWYEVSWLCLDRGRSQIGHTDPQAGALWLAECAELAIDPAGEIEDRAEYDAEVQRWYGLWAEPPQHIRDARQAGQAARLRDMLAWLDERGGAR
jgi:hypothetical protein